MNTTDDILKNTSNRQYPLPDKPWKQYQEWHKSLFLHWKAQPSLIAPLLPKGLTLDTINDESWITIVAFTVKKLKPKSLPAFPLISNFHEVNVRTYVICNGIHGIYFFSIEAQKLLPVLFARLLTGLPYIKSCIKRKDGNYHSKNYNKKYELDIDYSIDDAVSDKSALDYWLTERHCLYQDKGSKLYRIDVHHKEWHLQHLHLWPKVIHYDILEDDSYKKRPDLIHYSEVVKVLVWDKEEVINYTHS
jgi:uncharacterized protein YqjF (DUF2071 family)